MATSYPDMTALSALIPLAAWALFLACFRSRGFGWRIAFLAAAVLWGVWATLLAELFSFIAALNRPWIAFGWTILALVGGVLVFRAGTLPGVKAIPDLSRAEKLMAAAISVILACTFVVAVVSPPNNWDSMVYHMSRVMHWLQQGSVDHFPTSILRQIEMNPWAEYAILHFQVLCGGDHLANLVQWFSMAGCVIGVSVVAYLFAGTRRGQLLAGLIAATVPMGILQSSSTQNDLVVSFWLVCFVVFGILSVRERSSAWIALMSMSLGLAILTKGTAYVFSGPFLVWFFLQDMKNSWRQTAAKYLILGSIVLSLNLGHFQRNFRLFHNPFHSGAISYSNSRLTPAVVASNISRNLAIHLVTPSRTMNAFLVHPPLRLFHAAIGIAMDDPGTTWPEAKLENLRLKASEDTSGNPFHLILFLFAGALLACNQRFRSAVPYALSVLAGFLLFCIMLRWQPWGSRLHLPLFVLYCPVAGLVIAGLGKAWIERGVMLLLPLAAIPCLVFNVSRPLILLSHHKNYPSIFTIPRQSLYFINRPDIRYKFLAASALINNSRVENIGVKAGEDSWEYPLWVLTRKNGIHGPRIEHVGVTNVSRTIPILPFQPDCVVAINNSGDVTVEVRNR